MTLQNVTFLTLTLILLPFVQISQTQASSIDDKLKSLGIQLSTPSAPVANYVNAVRVGNLLFLAGKGPSKNGKTVKGKLGKDLTIKQGYAAARQTAINILSVLKVELKDLSRVKRIVKLDGMVNSAPTFHDQSRVINGASDLFVEIFGKRGKHARQAVGMASLPGNMAVEISVIVEIE